MNTLPASPVRALSIAWLLGLMGLTLFAVGMARWQGWQDRVPDPPTAWEMSLRFEDMPDGSVRVSDATDGRPLAVFAGEQGFLRGSLRAMARQRRVAQAERDAPLLLRELADGRLVLIDPTQGVRIDLDSFGPSNKAVFAGLRRASGTETGERP